MTPGPEMAFRLRFTGNRVLPVERLYNSPRQSAPSPPGWNPAAFEGAVERLYKEEGLLAADAEVLEPVIDGDPGADASSIVQVVIREGEPWIIGRVALEGAEVLSGSGAETIDFRSGMRYQARVVAAAAEKLERHFRQAGFLEAQVAVDTTVDDAARRVDLHVRAQPGPRSILTGVIVEGADPEKPLVARAIQLTPGSTGSAPSRSAERGVRCPDSGVFRNVEIALEPAAESAAPADLSGPPPSESVDCPVVARVRVEERARYRFRYGFALNDEVVSADVRQQRLGFAADLENRNLFGSGAILGLSARIRRDQQVGRVNLGANRFFGLPLRSNLFLSAGERRGRLGGGSRHRRVRCDGGERRAAHFGCAGSSSCATVTASSGTTPSFGATRPTDPFDLTVKVARFTSSGLVDRRERSVQSGARAGSPRRRGSCRCRGWAPICGSSRTSRQSWRLRRRWSRTMVLASAARLGLARNFKGEVLIPSERFFAGGATSVRGYREDDLGARSVFDDAEGGSGAARPQRRGCGSRSIDG